MWIPFWKAYQYTKNRITILCAAVSLMSPKLWSAALLLPTICHCTACLCPAIIEYHQGSIPAPSYTAAAQHDKLWQVIHSLLSSAMNYFTVISPQGCGIMSNLLLVEYLLWPTLTWPSRNAVYVFMSRRGVGLGWYLESKFPLNYCSGRCAQGWMNHMVDIMSLVCKFHTAKSVAIC